MFLDRKNKPLIISEVNTWRHRKVDTYCMDKRNLPSQWSKQIGRQNAVGKNQNSGK